MQCLHKDAKRRKAKRKAAERRQAEAVSRRSSMNMHAVVGILGSSNKMYDPLVTAVIDSVQCSHKDAKRRKAERKAAQKRQAEK